MIGSLPKPVSRAAVCGALDTVGPFLDHHCIISGRKWRCLIHLHLCRWSNHIHFRRHSHHQLLCIKS